MNVPDAVSLRPSGGSLPGTDLLWLSGIAMLAAAAWAIRGSLGRMMALDELYTVTLIGDPGLGHMIDGATRGVDGNPPLYLTLAWLLTHALPGPPDEVLRVFNLFLLAATAVLLARIGRRVADAPSVVAALALLCLIDGAVVYALLETRTYALYLCLVTATLWATLAVVDTPSRARATGLAIVGVLAALAHSFGGFYGLATIGAACLVCQAKRDRRRALMLGLAALPALGTTLAWICISFPRQIAVATPYGWISRPALADLIEALTGSTTLTLLGLFASVWFAARGRAAWLAAWRQASLRGDRATLVAVSAAYAALTSAGWIGSRLITPFFVDRYFIPNAVSAAILLISAMAALRRHGSPRLFAVAAVVCGLAGLAAVALGTSPTAMGIPCLAEDGRFLEDGLGGDLPIVTVSPHAWLPRNHYAPRRTALYPLDWGVVLNHPYRTRHNAMDFHIMEILSHWAPAGSDLAENLLPTGDLLSRHPHFLLLDETYRGWFSDLRAATPLSATLLRQSPGCRLWDIVVPRQP